MVLKCYFLEELTMGFVMKTLNKILQKHYYIQNRSRHKMIHQHQHIKY
ncbi:318R [Invertebrate iridescent virus Kaz2018]|uniref:318R n=1 Tax=Invertebrate iridescent virus 6 TaxID=176652 RepID=Q91FK6_IIV6|nr:318R [Invertebrate iridescent virus 6]AAK82179.1 318R [Invertebrate iridescent virus 6]QNH08728.1 318R [Invertebrate iridescent virus Kaz2018]